MNIIDFDQKLTEIYEANVILTEDENQKNAMGELLNLYKESIKEHIKKGNSDLPALVPEDFINAFAQSCKNILVKEDNKQL